MMAKIDIFIRIENEKTNEIIRDIQIKSNMETQDGCTMDYLRDSLIALLDSVKRDITDVDIYR